MVLDVLDRFSLVPDRKVNFRMDADMAILLGELVDLESTAAFHIAESDDELLARVAAVGRLTGLVQTGGRQRVIGLVLPLVGRRGRFAVSDGRGASNCVCGRSGVGSFANSHATQRVVPGEVEGGEGGGMPIG